MARRKKEKKTGSIIFQVAIFFAVCVIITALIIQVTQYGRTAKAVTLETETYAKETADEVILTVKEYPAYKWLVKYWYEHSSELDIDYDEAFASGTNTEQKECLLSKHQPQLNIMYAEAADLDALPEEDRKLYAEITYSWLITRLDALKSIRNADFMFCVITEPPYTDQFFLFSAADPGAVRGTIFGQIYPLGHTTTVSESQQDAMKNACEKQSHIADAGDYIDYYAYADSIDGHDALIGLTIQKSIFLDTIEYQSLRGGLIALGYQILLSLICLIGIFFLVLKPLKKVQANIRLYKVTKDGDTVRDNLSKVDAQNEIGELASDVTELTEEIDDYVDRISRITAEKERMQADLDLAARIQDSNLPHVFPPFPDRKEFELYAAMDPAREVGGDFYDYFFVDDDHLCLVIADVSGKGIPGAMFMMMSKIILKGVAKAGLSPAKVLAVANNDICADNNAQMFVTVWMGILEISTGILTAANAGHEFPALKKPGENFELYKDKHGFVIGGMPDLNFKEYQIQMEPGTKLFVYTDGVPEATDANDELFGNDRMIEALNSDPDAAPEQILKNVRAHVDAFVKDAEQFDDLTMMCIEYKGK